MAAGSAKKMKNVALALLLTSNLIGQDGTIVIGPTQPEVLTNESIVKLVKANMGESVIVSMVNNQPGQYALSTDAVISLKHSGVSEGIINAMISKGRPSSPITYKVPAPEPIVLHDATPIRLRLTHNLSSADAKTGQTIDFEVLDDVKVGELLVINRGGMAIGTVTDSEHKKRMARGGKLDVTIDFVRLVNGDKVALRGSKESRGGGHTGAMTGAIVATALVVWPAAPLFLFMHGKDVTIPKDTEITAYVNGEITLDPQKLAVR
jgi:hypothetical protein